MTPGHTEEIKAIRQDVSDLEARGAFARNLPAIISSLLTALGIGGTGLYATSSERQKVDTCNGAIVEIAQNVSGELDAVRTERDHYKEMCDAE